MDLMALKSELTIDPLARGYAAMGDEQAADSLNTPDRSVLRESVATYEIFEAIVPSEFDALSVAQKARVQILLTLGSVLINGANAQATLLGAFGAGTQTRTNLIALARQAGSRAQELKLDRVTPSDVANARRL
jgi:hypothetical protein